MISYRQQKLFHDFTTGMSFEAFVDDDRTLSAVLYKFAVMGEATKHLPEHIRAEYPDIPWRSIAGFKGQSNPWVYRY